MKLIGRRAACLALVVSAVALAEGACGDGAGAAGAGGSAGGRGGASSATGGNGAGGASTTQASTTGAHAGGAASTGASGGGDASGGGGACVPDCTGRACGSDGCSGDCGACGAPLACTSRGQCVGSPPGPFAMRFDVATTQCGSIDAACTIGGDDYPRCCPSTVPGDPKNKCFCDSDFDHVDRGPPHLVVVASDAHRGDIWAAGNAQAAYVNDLNDLYPGSDGGMKADAAMADAQTGFPSGVPTWFVANEISTSLWPTDPVYRQYVRAFAARMKQTYGKSVIVASPFPAPADNGSDWSALAGNAYVAVEVQLTGKEVNASGNSVSVLRRAVSGVGHGVRRHRRRPRATDAGRQLRELGPDDHVRPPGRLAGRLAQRDRRARRRRCRDRLRRLFELRVGQQRDGRRRRDARLVRGCLPLVRPAVAPTISTCCTSAYRGGAPKRESGPISRLRAHPRTASRNDATVSDQRGERPGVSERGRLLGLEPGSIRRRPRGGARERLGVVGVDQRAALAVAEDLGQRAGARRDHQETVRACASAAAIPEPS